jgi:hypothetical protein
MNDLENPKPWRNPVRTPVDLPIAGNGSGEATAPAVVILADLPALIRWIAEGAGKAGGVEAANVAEIPDAVKPSAPRD